MSNKHKHLDFIQHVISRSNSNSFVIKGWSITLTSALFALSASSQNLKYGLISYFVIIIFWILDGFYISTERKFRSLYADVILQEEESINYSMDVLIYNKNDNTWLRGILSKTLLTFYGGAIGLISILLCLIQG